MFNTPKFIQQSYSIVFKPMFDIRRRANDFEDALKEAYSIPQIIPVPDDFDPNAPRIIFGSKHGFSNIFISQLSITLQVSYDENYQTDEGQRIQYLRERIPVLYELLKSVKAEVAFSGLVTFIDISSNASEEDIMRRLRSHLNPDRQEDLYDIRFMFTVVRDNHYFVNTLIENYRVWSNEVSLLHIPRLPTSDSIEHGVRIQVDVNDRYAFNEHGTLSSLQNFETILERNIDETNLIIRRILNSDGG